MNLVSDGITNSLMRKKMPNLLKLFIMSRQLFFLLFAPHHPLIWETMARGENESCFIAIKITTIIITSRHLVLRSLGTSWSERVLGKGTYCTRERRIRGLIVQGKDASPPVHLT